MNIYIDNCHICLDQKYLLNKQTELCQNQECSGFICKSCWKQVIQNDITNCPICRVELSNDSKIYTRIQREIERKNMFRDYLKHIFFYLAFYSMGMVTIFLKTPLNCLINKFGSLFFIIAQIPYLGSVINFK